MVNIDPPGRITTVHALRPRAYGGFNGAYNYFSTQQFFWNNYGFMVLPNGTPILK